RQGEVEQLELPGAVLAALDAEVVRLDVAVAHALRGELVEGMEQVVREALQLVVGEPPLAAQSLAERLRAGVLQLQDGAPTELPQTLAAQLDDGAAADLAQRSLLGAE